MKKIIFLNIFFLLSIASSAQDFGTDKVDELNELANKSMRNPPQMKEKVDSAMLLSKQLGYKEGLGSAYKYNGIYYYFMSDFDSSVFNHRLSLHTYQELKDSLNTGKAYLNIATTYSAAASYDSTTHYAVIALKYFRALKDYPGVGRAVNLLGIVHFHQKNFENALKYFQQYLENAQQTSDSSEIASGYNNIASVLIELESYDSAINYFNEAIRLKEKLGNYNNLGQSYQSLGSLYSKRDNSQLALTNYQKAHKLYKRTGDRRFMSECEYNIGVEFKKLGQIDSAEKHLIEAITISEDVGALQILRQSKESYAGLLFLKGNGLAAYELLQEANILSDSILNREKIETISEIETKYETERKEQQIALQTTEIARQTAENERKVTLIIALVAILALLITLFFLFRNRSIRKQQLLVTERDIRVKEAQIEATLNSQESERKRFAADLHDGFGQLISALRLNMSNFSDKNTTENVAAFEHSEKILSEMHREIRAIAFNLMPHSLIQGGLLSAVEELALRLNKSGQITIQINSFGFEERLPEVMEISLYRIIQEWVSNVVKYAKASQIEIQLNRYDDEVNIIIEDNGQGIDKQRLVQSEGNGWKNIQSRISLLKGSVDVDSSVGRSGSSLICEVPIAISSPIEKLTQ